jgi:phosphoadenosine phosphosulfate reductase
MSATDRVLATESELLEEAAEADKRLAELPTIETFRWAADRFGDDVIVACSFQDCVIIDVAVKAKQSMEVVFLDTKFHFKETLAFVETCREFFDPLNLTVLKPGSEAAPWPCGSERCCETRKVIPINRYLEGKKAWITGLKRVDNKERQDAPIVSYDSGRGLFKINPFAAWTDDDINDYVAEHGLPEHPLLKQGYLSIGCAPTTRPVDAGEDARSGRWADTEKTECGLHI